MVRWLRWAAVCALTLSAQACGKTPVKDAGADVQALLAAVQAGDARGFETRLDRVALRADLRRQMIGVAHANGLDVGGPSDAALDRMIGPDAFHLIQAGSGAPLPSAPSAAQVQAQLKALDKAHVCLHAPPPGEACLLTFAKEPAGWRLVGMPADHAAIAIAPESGKK